MAVFFRDLEPAERVTLTTAMRDSGSVLTWDLDGPVLDKHSTGGVGDKVSLILAPVLAACGAYVPMISGRGLGHTGGTLDKLDSIPGYDSVPELGRLRAAVADAGCAIVGQTADLAPADRRLYALRDATGTVESIPLIVASILSKKLAEGLDGLVMDIKAGSGAFMPTREALRRARPGDRRGLRGRRPALHGAPHRHGPGARPHRRQRARGARVARRPARRHGRAAAGRGHARAGPRRVRARRPRRRPATGAHLGRRGRALDRMVHALGGTLGDLPEAPVRREVTGSGTVDAIDVRALGLVVMELGGGRRRETDDIDHAVGLADVAGLGEDAGRLATVHARDEQSAARAEDAVRAAFTTGDGPATPPPLHGAVAHAMAELRLRCARCSTARTSPTSPP